MLANAPKTERYGRYVDKQFFELIERFVPDVLWNDIGYPPKGNPLQTVKHYFNSVKLGAINDRWSLIPQVANILSHTFLIKKMINYIGKKVVASQGFEGHRPKGFSDFSTPEYQPNIGLKDYKWESCRGIGHSFGYNRMETAEQYLSERELIHSFVDTISKNGNLLLNIGPTAAGKIPEIQLKRLLALGQFIRRNEEGIYDTNTWQRATGTTTNGLPVRFTQKKNTLFVFLLGNPQCSKITIKNVKIPSSSKISLMGTDESIGWEQFGVDLRLNLPHTFPEFLSMGFKVSLA